MLNSDVSENNDSDQARYMCNTIPFERLSWTSVYYLVLRDQNSHCLVHVYPVHLMIVSSPFSSEETMAGPFTVKVAGWL